MTPAELVRTARLHGATLLADGGALLVQAAAPLPAELVEMLRQHKPALLALLAPADPLDAWLGLPVPTHCEPPTDRPTVAGLHVLAARMDGWIEHGTRALAASPDHPHAGAATLRLEERRAARGALGELLAALGGKPYDRVRLAVWTAGQLFREGDMPAVLEVVDAIHDARWVGFLPGQTWPEMPNALGICSRSGMAQPMEPATPEDRAVLPFPGSGTTAAAHGQKPATRCRFAPGKELPTRWAFAPGKECATRCAFAP